MKRKNKSQKKVAQNSNHVQSSTEVGDLVLWRSPLMTLYCAFMELLVLTKSFGSRFLTRTRIAVIIVCLITVCLLSQTDGPHQDVLDILKKNISWSMYWLGLGVLSSVGFGFGLHTFVLYLAPHVISVTLAAYECGSVYFPQPPYPDKILCPTNLCEITPFVIFHKVIWECFMWGVGTAIGELPPYFLARTCRLSGMINEEEAEIEAIMKNKQKSQMTFKEKSKIFIHNLVNKAGFPGILLCASFPNPLYDLAGLTCGHFLIPFWTFFGATLIGKACIKMSIQTLFVIFIFSEKHVVDAIILIKKIPYIGEKVGPSFEDFLEKQKLNLRIPKSSQETSWFSWCFQFLTLAIVLCFVVGVINALAQNYKRSQSEQQSNAQKLT